MKRYTSYKDSGQSWVGEIPSHWELKPNRSLFRDVGKTVENAGEGVLLLSLTQKGLIPRDMENPSGKFPSDFSTYQKVAKGDLVFCLFDVDETPRTVGISNHEGMITGAYTVMRCYNENHARYLYWFYLSLDEAKRLKPLYRGLRKVVPAETFRSIKSPIPPEQEARKICDYIETQVFQMDTAISSQERMIELLKERRSAIITQTVTKGLDPKAKMKDSGDPRLGLIPEKWEAVPLRFLGRLNGGAGFPDDEQLGRDGDIDFYKVKDLGAASPEGYMAGSDNSVSEEKAKRLGAYIFQPHSILFAKVGAALLMNRFRLSKSRFCADNNLMGFEPTQVKIAASYCYFAMQTIDFADIVNPGTVPSINERQVSSIRIPVPPLEEQSVIANKLAKDLSTLDELSAKAFSCVNLLKERRSALITQAVTGQIDVR